MFTADLLDDYSYMQQCGVGFSGVLFAMKVRVRRTTLPTSLKSVMCPNECGQLYGILPTGTVS
jgi:hypothetical protein